MNDGCASYLDMRETVYQGRSLKKLGGGGWDVICMHRDNGQLAKNSIYSMTWWCGGQNGESGLMTNT